jgi:hypothetical protein
MNRRTGSLVAAILAIATMPARAQWLNYPTPGIPRLPDGKPNLAAPAPRKPDGKPNLSGIWQMDRSGVKYIADVAADFKPGEFPIQPWAEALVRERRRNQGSEYPPAHCLPPSIPVLDEGSAIYPIKIVQEPDLVVILNEYMGLFRQLFLDGRVLPKDPNPTWLGYSVGRWDGDALVVDSTGFNGRAWLDGAGGAGHPSTEALHITERFLRRDFGHLDLQITIDDPKAYTKPWTVAVTMHISPDSELLEFVCNENEKDLKHQPGQ